MRLKCMKQRRHNLARLFVRRRLESREQHKDDMGQTSSQPPNTGEGPNPSTDPSDKNVEAVAFRRLDRASHKDAQDTHIVVEPPPEVQDECSRNGKQVKHPKSIGTYFRDGRRKIDYVLVHEEVSLAPSRNRNHNTTIQSSLPLPFRPEEKSLQGGMRPTLLTSTTHQNTPKQNRKIDIRKTFIDKLKSQGIEIEEEFAEGKRANVRFIKLHAPFPLLAHWAEELGFRARILCQAKADEDNWSARLFKSLRLPNCFAQEIPGDPPKVCCTYPFRRSKIATLLGNLDSESYFTSTERSRIVNEILARTTYGDRRKGEVGIERLLKEGVYTASYPLHEGCFQRKVNGNEDQEKLNPRQILHGYWARWSKWSKYQPLDNVREYFGEKIAFYFAWLGFYTGWLIPPSIVGVLIFVYGLLTVDEDPASSQVCHSIGQYPMCPLCEESQGCHQWDLSDVCTYSKLSYLFDHPGTVAFAIFVSFWAVTFLEYWKRYSARLAHRWDVVDVEREEIRPRPEFALKAPSIATNPVTGIAEPAFPHSVRRKRIMAGVCFVFLMVCMVIIFIVAIIIYRIVVSIPLFQHETLKSQAQVIANLSGAVVNLVLIMALGRFYEKLAYKLTTWEMHRTQIEFEDNLTFKVFAFQFVNLYASIFYIAFFKGRFVGYPGNYLHIFGLRNEECSAGGCLVELSQQLFIIMVGKQVINNAQEILWPKAQAWWQNRKVEFTQDKGKSKRWEADYQLVENAGLFQEYLEMVMQFGFITIFVAAFPLAPLFALLNNVVEIRLDAQKFVCNTRRTVGHQAKNIGIWLRILEFLVHLAVISNAFLISFTSEFLPKILYQYEHSWSMDGYVNFTLAISPKGSMIEPCYYRSFRDEDGNLTAFYWKLLVVRLAFVVIFEHFVFGVCRLIDAVVPDVPKTLAIKMKRDRYLAKQILQDPEHHIRISECT
ncbi:anoctamin-7-like isoform X1 [Daphnia carinata]|uniref:anoctamin-7-like isoform X1 n=2 Tax=Daphnia carinata TaxID=120202 RepID=UPI00257C1C1F|nr:anoctamin-7-like isoform X1 [Daphnia carinata]